MAFLVPGHVGYLLPRPGHLTIEAHDVVSVDASLNTSAVDPSFRTIACDTPPQEAGMETVTAILLLLGAHYVADFAMQNEYVATAKGDTTRPDWFHALTAHSAHHAVAAGLALALLGLPWLSGALVIGGTHWLIDYGKAVRGWYGYHVDQGMHVGVAIGVGFALAL